MLDWIEQSLTSH